MHVHIAHVCRYLKICVSMQKVAQSDGHWFPGRQALERSLGPGPVGTKDYG